ncbi:hypothetical protein [Anaerostipes sp.]|jgi:hypothetical protein
MKRGKSKMRQSKRKRIVFIVTVISIIVVLGIVGLFKSGAMIQKDYKKPVRYKKLKYLSYKLEDHYNKKIFCSSGIKEMPYEYQIKKNGKLYGTLIDEYGYPLKKYGQLGNGKKDGWYFGDSDKECWFKPKKVMKDVAAVHMGSGGIIVTRMDGSKWATGIGFGNERSESGKKVSTRFVMISK